MCVSCLWARLGRTKARNYRHHIPFWIIFQHFSGDSSLSSLQSNTKMVVSSGFPRDQETYEADTVRVDFINKENLQKMIEIYGKK